MYAQGMHDMFWFERTWTEEPEVDASSRDNGRRFAHRSSYNLESRKMATVAQQVSRNQQVWSLDR